ncbi:MAG TPA: 50S ribosomal protein L24e [Candidatus Aenigmarchaeota archaeon]|nr:50S ribosomal protein L24e [Candidatus Aenigmarchaeota archaeon]
MKCSFCGKPIPKGRGKMFVKLDGTIYYWCSSKCERNFWMKGRKKPKWAR